MKLSLVGGMFFALMIGHGLPVLAQPAPASLPEPVPQANQLDPAAVARVIEAQKQLNEFIRKALEADPEFDRLRDVSVQENAKAQKLLDEHPALKELNQKKRDAMQRFSQANQTRNAEAARKAEIELAGINKEIQGLVAGIPEITEQLERGREARAAFRAHRDKLIAADEEGRRLQKAADDAKSALIPKEK